MASQRHEASVRVEMGSIDASIRDVDLSPDFTFGDFLVELFAGAFNWIRILLGDMTEAQARRESNKRALERCVRPLGDAAAKCRG